MARGTSDAITTHQLRHRHQWSSTLIYAVIIELGFVHVRAAAFRQKASRANMGRYSISVGRFVDHLRTSSCGMSAHS
jgi:hypothetical protein